MKTNKKIIALVCALSMVFSVFAGFATIAQAANEGIVLSSETAKDKKSATITAKYTGFDTGVANFTIVLNMPSDKVDSVDAVCGYANVEPIENFKTAENIYKYVVAGSKDQQLEDNTLATFTINFKEALTEDIDFALQNDSTIGNGDNSIFLIASDENGTLAKTSTTVLADPDATPKPTAPARPTVPDDVEKPTVKEPVEVGANGIVLESALAADKKSATVTAKYVGFDTGVANFTIVLNMPSDKVDSVDAVCGYADVKPIENFKTAENIYKYVVAGAEDQQLEDNTLATFTINFKEALTEDMDFALQNDSTIGNGDNSIFLIASDENGTLAKTYTTVKAAASLANTTNAEKMGVNTSVIDASEDTADGTTPYYAVLEATKNGAAATYGTDYKAYYNGTALTEDQMNAYLTGKWGSVADALANMTFEYNNGVSLTLSLCKDGVSTVLSQGTTVTSTPTPTPKFTAPTLSVSPASKTITVGTKVTITPTLKENDAVDGVLTVDTGDADSYALKVNVDDDTKVVSFTAALKGKVTVTYTYDYKDADGAEKTLTKTSVITIKNSSDSSSDSSSSSSDSSSGSMGPIAGSSSTVNGVTYSSTFTDLGDVSWAAEAINVLASKGIISGRDAYTFDPNANITRAEYCQILVGAIDKTQESADSYFDDVASNAWYYHAISVASVYGIVSGYGDGNFGPNDLITRQDMALMTYKAAQVVGKSLAAQRTLVFDDNWQISDYAVEAVNTLANAGIINGMSESEFAPLNNATRAQAAVILYQAFVK